jgi:hypothetical protein
VYVVLGEAKSDAETIKALVLRLAGRPKTRVNAVGANGCGDLLNTGARRLRALRDLGWRRFVISYDADNHDPKERRAEVVRTIAEPAQITEDCCIVIPVQEIEAWILADIEAVSKVFPSWRPKPTKRNPETIASPKEYLESQSRLTNKKPIYAHATHNELVAKHLQLDVVAKRCPSFRPLVAFVKKG